jgi:S1-C subfamily serine protease
MVKVVIASAKGGGTTVKRPWLGAKLQAVTPEIAESLGLKRPAGALVASLSNPSPAIRAGLKTGDLIVAIDGQVVEDPNAFDYRFATKALGGTAQLGIVRGGKEQTLKISLETAPETPRDEIVIQSRSPFMGVKVANVSPALAEELRLDPNTEGVVILDIAQGSIAQNLGFQRGDVIASVNEEKIARTRDLDRVSKDGRRWAITVIRGGQQISVRFGG